MHIDNLRFGFACNSSSTHSVVWYPKHTFTDDLCEDAEFGWGKFVAASEEARKSYLKTLIYGRLAHFGDATAKMVAESFFPGDEIKIGYVDHQSIPLIPRKYGHNEPDYDFFREMVDYVMRDGVVIHGGNDNEEADTPPESNVAWYNKIPEDVRDEPWVCRHEGDWWILFNRDDGTKLTLSFKDNPAPRTMAVNPELVDLKITDFCPYACTYCYQGSTHKGEHADDPYGWIYSLQTSGVFEVAIGGGEPTLHPSFKQLLSGGLKDLRINFTTRNIDWVCHNADLIKNCGSFAVSVDDYHKTKEILDQLDKAGVLEKACLQYVMGTADDFNFEYLIKLCAERGVRMTLLGYKLTGRGAKAKKRLPKASIQEGAGWIDLVKEHSHYLAIDTALAARVPQGVFDEVNLRRLEGTHSMYIDAVTETAGISSYTDKDMLPVKKFGNSITEVFGKLQTMV